MNRIKLLCAAIAFFSILSWIECNEGLAAHTDEAGRLVPQDAFAVIAVGSPKDLRQEVITISNVIQPAMADFVRTTSMNHMLAPYIHTKQTIDLSQPMMLVFSAPTDRKVPQPFTTLILAIKGGTTDNVKLGPEAGYSKAQLVFLPNSDYVAVTNQPGLKASANAPEIIKDMLKGNMAARVDVTALLAAMPDDQDSAPVRMILKDVAQIDWAMKLGLKETQTVCQFTCAGNETLGASDVYAMTNLASYLPKGKMIYGTADLDFLNAIINFDQSMLQDLTGSDAKTRKQLVQSLEDAKVVLGTMKEGCAVSMDVEGDQSKNTQMSMFMVTASDDPKAYFDATLKEWKSEESLYGMKMSGHNLTTATNGDVTLNASFDVDQSAKDIDNPMASLFHELSDTIPGSLKVTGVSGNGLIGVAAFMGGPSETSTELKNLQSGKRGSVPPALATAMKSSWGQTRMAMTMDLRKLTEALIKTNPNPGDFGPMIVPPGPGEAAPMSFILGNKANQYRLVMTTNLERDIALAKDATKNTFIGMFWQNPQIWTQMKQQMQTRPQTQNQHQHQSQ